MENPKVSVLMCVFNCCEFLCSAIGSVLGQPYKNIELIIIDDDSTDDSWQIACEFAAQDPRVVTIRSPVNQGASAALNKGLKISTGDFITRQDSDDTMAPERLVEQVAYLQQYPNVGAIGTNIVYIDLIENVINVSSYPLTNEEIQETLPDRMCFCGPTVMVRREAFAKAGFYYAEEYSTAEDYDLCLRLAEVTQMGNLAGTLYRYRQHPGSVSAMKRHHQLYFKVRALEQAAFRRYGLNPPQKFIVYIARDYLRSAILGCFSNEIASAKKCLELAQHYHPKVLVSGSLQPPLDEMIRRYLPRQSFEASLVSLERLFQDLFTQNYSMTRLKCRLIGELYIEEAFTRANHSPTPSFDLRLIWMGIRYDPGWLTNRGILSILFRNTVNRRTLPTLPPIE